MDKDALATRLYRAHAGPLRTYVARLLGDRHRGEDVVQEALLRAWLHADRLIDDDTALRAWLYRVAHNLAVDEVRRRGARPDEVLGDAALSVSAAAHPSSSGPDAGDVSEGVLTRIDLDRALRRLSPEHRGVLVAIFYLNRTTYEAADILRIPHGTAKSRLYYGLRHLRSALVG